MLNDKMFLSVLFRRLVCRDNAMMDGAHTWRHTNEETYMFYSQVEEEASC